MKKIPERNEIAQKDKWAIEDLYASPDLWQEDLKKLQELGQKLAAFSGKLHISAQNLLDYMPPCRRGYPHRRIPEPGRPAHKDRRRTRRADELRGAGAAVHLR